MTFQIIILLLVGLGNSQIVCYFMAVLLGVSLFVCLTSELLILKDLERVVIDLSLSQDPNST